MTQARGDVKTCSRCKSDKNISDFHKSIREIDGRSYWCKSCCSQDYKRRCSERSVTRSIPHSKICFSCKTTKLSSAFSRCRQSRDGLKNVCKECTRPRGAASYLKRTNKVRESSFRRLYGLTLEDYDRMYKNQSFLCKICSKPEPISTRRLAVDHCHKTNKVRGLLCSRCNTAIGKFFDNPDLLEKAAEYIRTEGTFSRV